MSLRTLATHLKEHNWTSVVIEVLIVVAGVFVGLQVSNWNDERRESARGDEYLQRLRGELLGDATALESISRFWAGVRSNGMVAIAYAEDGTLEQGSAWRTLLAYYQASQVWPYRKPDTTFQEIVSSGDLQLIRNPGLRARIATHYGAGAGSQVVEVLGLIPAYRERVRGMTPWRIQQYIWSNCYKSVDANQLLLDCESPVTEAEALAVLQRYRQTSQLTSDLRFWMVNVDSGLMLMRDIKRQAEVLARDVQGEFAR